MWSNRIGEIQQKPKPIKNEPSVFYTNFKNRENYSGFLEHQSQFENWLISAGTLLNYNTQFGFSVFPGADISYNLNAQNQIYFSGNRSLRFPTFTELYLNTATVKSDPNLLPEKASTFEMGYKNFSPILNTVVTVFYRKTTDAIDKIKRPENPVPTMENINNINMFGLEYSNIFNLKGWGNQKVIQNIILNYAYLKADRKEENFQSFYTLNYLSHKLNCGVETKPFSGMEWSLWYTLKIREGNYQWDNNSPILAYPKVNLFDTRFAYKIKKNRIFLDINNLFNLTYFEHGFVELPGRWISLGLNLNY